MVQAARPVCGMLYVSPRAQGRDEERGVQARPHLPAPQALGSSRFPTFSRPEDVTSTHPLPLEESGVQDGALSPPRAEDEGDS